MKKVEVTNEELYLLYILRSNKWGKIEISMANGRPEVIKIEKTKKPRVEMEKPAVLTKIFEKFNIE